MNRRPTTDLRGLELTKGLRVQRIQPFTEDNGDSAKHCPTRQSSRLVTLAADFIDGADASRRAIGAAD